MGGGLIQLIALGAQDIYLTGNPQVTFFKLVYRRHTNFSIETIQQEVEGNSRIHGGNGHFTISRNGDLISNIFMTFKNTNRSHDYHNDNLGNYVLNGSNIIKKISIEIGGQIIDTHTNDWMNIYNEHQYLNQNQLD